MCSAAMITIFRQNDHRSLSFSRFVFILLSPVPALQGILPFWQLTARPILTIMELEIIPRKERLI